MIKNIKYYFGIGDIDFKTSDFLGNVLELIPKITVDVEFDNCLIEGIEIFHTRDGFLVELDSKKISDIKSGELDKFLNNNQVFINSFDNFIKLLKRQKSYGEILIE